MKRNKFNLSHYVLQTGNMGVVYPITWYEVLPGDSIQQQTSILLRMTPLVAPVMHPVKVRVHNFFVPNRLIWENWEKFITGEGEYAFPNIIFDSVPSDGLAHTLGLPAGTYSSLAVSALPFRAYLKIWNDYYRDQDLVGERPFSMGSGNDTTTGITLQRCFWEKDYFTTARPWTSKGDEILIPIGDTAPVTGNVEHPTFKVGSQQGVTLEQKAGVTDLKHSGSAEGADSSIYWDNPELEADLSAATGISVNDLRTYLAQQRYQEARARFGSRYSEYIKYLAPGIGNLDARLQDSEYLGGGSNIISFSEVIQTQRTDTGETPLGTMGGHAISSMRTRRFRRFFPEHGIVMSLLTVIPKAIYTQQIERKWHRLNKEMYFQKELQFIGEQPITNNEVYSEHSDPTGTFGYVPRYDEYRYIPSQVRRNFATSVADNWHYSRIFDSDVALNESFATCSPARRPSADQTSDMCMMMIYHNIKARRILSKWSTPKTF